jgi:hypothetical protein
LAFIASSHLVIFRGNSEDHVFAWTFLNDRESFSFNNVFPVGSEFRTGLDIQIMALNKSLHGGFSNYLAHLQILNCPVILQSPELIAQDSFILREALLAFSSGTMQNYGSSLVQKSRLSGSGLDNDTEQPMPSLDFCIHASFLDYTNYGDERSTE